MEYYLFKSDLEVDRLYLECVNTFIYESENDNTKQVDSDKKQGIIMTLIEKIKEILDKIKAWFIKPKDGKVSEYSKIEDAVQENPELKRENVEVDSSELITDSPKAEVKDIKNILQKIKKGQYTDEELAKIDKVKKTSLRGGVITLSVLAAITTIRELRSMLPLCDQLLNAYKGETVEVKVGNTNLNTAQYCKGLYKVVRRVYDLSYNLTHAVYEKVSYGTEKGKEEYNKLNNVARSRVNKKIVTDVKQQVAQLNDKIKETREHLSKLKKEEKTEATKNEIEKAKKELASLESEHKKLQALVRFR
jgi:hypothetical protein